MQDARDALLAGPTGPLGKIRQAAHRLNPSLDLEADIVAVQGGAKISTAADWGTLTNVQVDAQGLLTLTKGAPTSVFSNTAGFTILHDLQNATGLFKVKWLDFFVDTGALPSPLQINSVTLKLGRQFFGAGGPTFNGAFVVQLFQFDESWIRVPLGDPIVILASAIAAAGTSTVVVDFSQQAKTFIPQRFRTVSGAGRDNTGALRTQGVDPATGYSQIYIPRGFSVMVRITGATHVNSGSAFIACTDNATLANFDPNTFWRAQAAPGLRAHGPYDPSSKLFDPLDLAHNAQPGLTVGPVPGFGAKAVANGFFGADMQVSQNSTDYKTANDAARDAVTQPWAVPYHDLKVETFSASGNAVSIVDLGAVPTTDVEFKADYTQPFSTTVTFSLRGSNISAAGAWTVIGAITDGTILTGANRFRWYELTTTLTAAAGATKFATPAVQAAYFLARVRYGTTRYDSALDTTATLDPVTGDSEIAEFKLPLLKLTRDARDLATLIGSAYAPANLEARVYAVNRISGDRLYLNSFRLESHTGSDLDEQFTFLSGMDRLKVLVPLEVESYVFLPTPGVHTVSAVAVTGSDVQITVAGAPAFPTTSPNEYGFTGIQGYLAYYQTMSSVGLSGQWVPIISTRAASANSFWVTPASTNASDYPAVGDLIQVHSNQFKRYDKGYGGQDYAAIYADVIQNQAKVPARLIGRLPATTGRVAPTGTVQAIIAAKGRTAIDVLKEIALHCGGAVTWDRGQIHFVSLYDGISSVAASWDERHYVTLETPIGADRRMPRINCGYNYNPTTQAFQGFIRYTDMDAFYGSGLPNLFDVTELTDTLAAWGDQAEATFLTTMLGNAWSTGVRLWKVATVLSYPWLMLGDAVAISTDQYVDHASSFSGDGITDTGSPVAGRVRAVGRIVGKNLWGNEFVVAIFGLPAVVSTVQGIGAAGGPYEPIAIPSDFVATANVQGDPATGLSAWVQATYTPPPTPYFARMDYSVASRRTGEATFGAVVLVTGSRGGNDRIIAHPGTDVQITPITVSTGNVRLNGTPVVVAVPFWISAGPTFSADVATGGAVTYAWTYDKATVYMEVWTQEYTADPGTVPSVELIGTMWTTIYKSDGRSSIAIPLAASANYRVTTFIAFDAYGLRGTPRTTKTQGTGAAAPGPPGAVTNTSIAGRLITNKVVLNASATSSWKIRIYVNGVQQSPDYSITAGDVAATFAQVPTTVALPNTAYGFTYSHIDTQPLESTKTANVNVTSGADTIPTPGLSLAYDTDAFNIVVTVSPAGGTPAGVLWHVKRGLVNPPTVEDVPAASTSTTLETFWAESGSIQTVYVKIWGTLSGWTQSADSVVKSLIIPKSGGPH